MFWPLKGFLRRLRNSSASFFKSIYVGSWSDRIGLTVDAFFHLWHVTSLLIMFDGTWKGEVICYQWWNNIGRMSYFVSGESQFISSPKILFLWTASVILWSLQWLLEGRRHRHDLRGGIFALSCPAPWFSIAIACYWLNEKGLLKSHLFFWPEKRPSFKIRNKKWQQNLD